MILLFAGWALAGPCATEAGEVLQTGAPIAFTAEGLDARAAVEEIACAMLANPVLKLQIGVHTDAQGSGAFNLRKSQERAVLLQDALINAGVPANRVSAVGFGETRPIASNQTAEGRAQNRRVELRIGPPLPPPPPPPPPVELPPVEPAIYPED